MNLGGKAQQLGAFGAQLDGLDETELRKYFPLDQVLEKGVFAAAERLYGITVGPRRRLPTRVRPRRSPAGPRAGRR